MEEIAPTPKPANHYTPTSPVSAEELRVGMMHAARLVRRYGMIYWPVVERLQSEVAAVEQREALLDKLLSDEHIDPDS